MPRGSKRISEACNWVAVKFNDGYEIYGANSADIEDYDGRIGSSVKAKWHGKIYTGIVKTIGNKYYMLCLLEENSI